MPCILEDGANGGSVNYPDLFITSHIVAEMDVV